MQSHDYYLFSNSPICCKVKTMQNQNLKKIVMSALFAALTCAATFIIRIPTPGTVGYIHPGDALVILSGLILGPSYGFAAAGIGSALADLLGGYIIYVPVTFIVKGVAALIAGELYRRIGHAKKRQYAAVALSGFADIILVIGGYFLYEMCLYGTPAAVTNILANLLQGAGGLLISLILWPILSAIPDVRQMADD